MVDKQLKCNENPLLVWYLKEHHRKIFFEFHVKIITPYNVVIEPCALLTFFRLSNLIVHAWGVLLVFHVNYGNPGRVVLAKCFLYCVRPSLCIKIFTDKKGSHSVNTALRYGIFIYFIPINFAFHRLLIESSVSVEHSKLTSESIV